MNSALLSSVPYAQDDDRVLVDEIYITNDISRSSERHDQFPHCGDTGWSTTIGHCRQRIHCAGKYRDRAVRYVRVLLAKKSMQPLEVRRGFAGNNELHNLRGLGGGSSFGVPQLCIQFLISCQGTPSRPF